MPGRGIMRFLLGSATPFQIMAAAALGGMLGFMPGARAAGLIVGLVLVLLVLNANLFVAALTAAGAKLASLLVMPLTFQVGYVLLDGPTEGVFRTLINTPVSALLGLEYYVATGGLVTGLIFGLMAGWPVVLGLRLFRSRMARLEESSERYQRLRRRWWVKALMVTVFGVRPGRVCFRELMEKRTGSPIRPIGAGIAVVVVGAMIATVHFAGGSLVRLTLRDGLERANGATVDIRSLELDLAANRLVIDGLAMADPNDLGRDLLRAESVEADLAGLDLLRKRLVLDRVALRDAWHGAERSVPGRRVGPAASDHDEEHEVSPGAETLDDYLRTAQRWRDRLQQLRRWLEQLSGSDEVPEAPRPDDDGEGQEETLRERLARRARKLGHDRVRAEHLIEGTPTLLIRELLVEEIRTAELPEGETLTLHAWELSSHPGRHQASPRIEVHSSAGTLDVVALLEPGGLGEISFAARGLPAESMGRHWRGSDPPWRGGTIDVEGDVGWGRPDNRIDLTLHDTIITIPGAGPNAVDRLVLPIRLLGPPGDLRILVDDEALAAALTDAGVSALTEHLRDRLEPEVGALASELEEKVGERIGERIDDRVGDALGDRASRLLGELMGGGRQRDGRPDGR